MTSDPLQLLDEIDLGSARGGRKPATPVEVEVVRSLTKEDLPLLLEPPTVSASGQQILRIRHSHHQLAQLLAKGCEVGEAALITGYSVAYISTISNNDAAFGELLAHYASEREAVFVDVLERMRVLGLSTLDELQRRLEDEKEPWTRRELMEMAELLLIKPQTARSSGSPSGGANVNLQVKFVQAPTAQRQSETMSAVDVEFTSEDAQ